MRVSINELIPESCQEIQQNCTQNLMVPKYGPETVKSPPESLTDNGEIKPEDKGGNSEVPGDQVIEIIQEDANITMHRRQFHFM